MPTKKNTSYKVHVQHTDQSEVDSVNIETVQCCTQIVPYIWGMVIVM